MSSYLKFQAELLHKIKTKAVKSLPKEIEEAYLNTPRHLFVREYFKFEEEEWKKIVVGEEPAEDQLSEFYKDDTIALMPASEKYGWSSISQPSFVLLMLDMLKLKPGHKVLEIGAASGWNASLIGKLVGPGGHVYSIEIIPDLAKLAGKTISRQKIENVTVIEGDGGQGYTNEAPYDRITYTAGSYNIPFALHSQLKEDGILLFILKNKAGGDTLFLLKKKADHLVSINSMPCGFVALSGEHQNLAEAPIDIAAIPFWMETKDQLIFKQSFWWGSISPTAFYHALKTIGISSFLYITEPLFEAFEAEKNGESSTGYPFFGLVDHENKSVAIFKDDLLLGYGNDKALKRLKKSISFWLDKGMPNASCFELKVYAVDAKLKPKKNQWLTKKSSSQLLWALDDNYMTPGND
jgi:protein-L-isoaspartate(D-aspartate) O-methyltransferase